MKKDANNDCGVYNVSPEMERLCDTKQNQKKMRSIVIYTSQINDCTLPFSNKKPIIIFDVLGK